MVPGGGREGAGSCVNVPFVSGSRVVLSIGVLVDESGKEAGGVPILMVTFPPHAVNAEARNRHINNNEVI